MPGIDGDENDDLAPADIRLPLPAAVNPHLAELHGGALRWAESMGLVVSPAARRRFLDVDVATLAALTFPTTDRAGLELAIDWCNWLFLFDDQADEADWGRDPREWDRLAAPLADLLDAPAAFDAPGSPLVQALAQLLERSDSGASADWRARLRRDLHDFLRSYSDEAERRRVVAPPRLLDYIGHRRHSGGTRVVIDIVERTEGAEIPPEWFAAREVQDVVLTAVDVVCWTNDLYSLRKELAAGDVHNLVVVIAAESGCELREALARATRMTEARAEAHGVARALVEEMLEASGLPPDRRAGIVRCLAAYGAWMRGNADWSKQTSRYAAAGDRGEGTPYYVERLLGP